MAHRSSYRPGSVYSGYGGTGRITNTLGSCGPSNYGGVTPSTGGFYSPGTSPWDCYKPRDSYTSGYISDYGKSGYNSDYKSGYVSDYGKSDLNRSSGGYTSDYGQVSDYGKRSSLKDYGKTNYGASSIPSYSTTSYTKPNESYSSYRRPNYDTSYKRNSYIRNTAATEGYGSYSRSSSKEEEDKGRNSYSRSNSRETASIEEEEHGEDSDRNPTPLVPICHSESKIRHGDKAPADFSSDSETETESESEEESSSSEEEDNEGEYLMCRSTSPSKLASQSREGSSPSITEKLKRPVTSVCDTKDSISQTEGEEPFESKLPVKPTPAYFDKYYAKYTRSPSKPNNVQNNNSSNNLKVEEEKQETFPVYQLNVDKDLNSSFSRDSSPNIPSEPAVAIRPKENVNKDFRKSVLNMNLNDKDIENFKRKKDDDRLKERKFAQQQRSSPYSSSSSSDSSSSEYEYISISKSSSKSGLPRANSGNKINGGSVSRSSSKNKLEVQRTGSKGKLNLPRSNSHSKSDLSGSSRSKSDVSRSGSRTKLNLPKSVSKSKTNLVKTNSNLKIDSKKSTSSSKSDLSRSGSGSSNRIETSSSKSKGDLSKCGIKGNTNLSRSSSKGKCDLLRNGSIDRRYSNGSREKLNLPRCESRGKLSRNSSKGKGDYDVRGKTPNIRLGSSSKLSSSNSSLRNGHDKANKEESESESSSEEESDNFTKISLNLNKLKLSTENLVEIIQQKVSDRPPRPNKKDNDHSKVSRTPSISDSFNERKNIRKTNSKINVEKASSSSKSSSSEQLSSSIPMPSSKNNLSQSNSTIVITVRPPLPKCATKNTESPTTRKLSDSSETSSSSVDDEEVKNIKILNDANDYPIKVIQNTSESDSKSIESNEPCRADISPNVSFTAQLPLVKKSPTVIHLSSNEEKNVNSTSALEDDDESEITSSSSSNIKRFNVKIPKLNAYSSLAPLIYRKRSSISDPYDSFPDERRDSSFSEQSKTSDKKERENPILQFKQKRDSIKSNVSKSSNQENSHHDDSNTTSSASNLKADSSSSNKSKTAKRIIKRKVSANSKSSNTSPPKNIKSSNENISEQNSNENHINALQSSKDSSNSSVPLFIIKLPPQSGTKTIVESRKSSISESSFKAESKTQSSSETSSSASGSKKKTNKSEKSSADSNKTRDKQEIHTLTVPNIRKQSIKSTTTETSETTETSATESSENNISADQPEVEETIPEISKEISKPKANFENKSTENANSFYPKTYIETKYIGELQDIDSLIKEFTEQTESFEDFENTFKHEDNSDHKSDSPKRKLSLFIGKFQDIDDMLGAISPISPGVNLAGKLQTQQAIKKETSEESDDSSLSELEEVAASAVKVHESKAHKPQLESYTEEIDSSAVRIRENRALNPELQQMTEEIDSEDVRIREAKLMKGHVSKRPNKMMGECVLQFYTKGGVNLEKQSNEIPKKEIRKGEVLQPAEPETKVRTIIDKLLHNTGTELRKTLFTLKSLFQDERELVKAFVDFNGLSCLIKIATENDHNYQNHVLRALGQIMLYVDGINGVINCPVTLKWIYSLLFLRFQLMVKMALKLLIIFVDYVDSNAILLMKMIHGFDKSRDAKPWCNIINILKSESLDMEILSFSMIFMNKVLGAIHDQSSYYDIVDCLEEQDMALISQKYLASPSSSTELIQQFQLYEAVLNSEDGNASKFSSMCSTKKQKALTSQGEPRKSWRATYGNAHKAPLTPTKKQPVTLWLNKQEEKQKEESLSNNEGSNVGITPALRRHRERVAQNRSLRKEEAAKEKELETPESIEPPKDSPFIPKSPSLVKKHRSKFETKFEEEPMKIVPKEEPTKFSTKPFQKNVATPTQINGSKMEVSPVQEKKKLIIKRPKNFDQILPQIAKPQDKKLSITPEPKAPELKDIPLQPPLVDNNVETVEKSFQEKQKMFQKEPSPNKMILPKSFNKSFNKSDTKLNGTADVHPAPLKKDSSKKDIPMSPKLLPKAESNKKTWLGSRVFSKSKEEEKVSPISYKSPSPVEQAPPPHFKREPSPKLPLKRESSIKDIYRHQKAPSPAPPTPMRSPSQSQRFGDSSGIVNRAKEGLSASVTTRSDSRTNILMKQPSSSSLAEFKHEIQWDNMLNNLKRPLLINDLDFTDLEDEDDIDIFKPSQTNMWPSPSMMNGGGGIPPPPPPLFGGPPPPPPPPGCIPPPPPFLLNARPNSTPPAPFWAKGNQAQSGNSPATLLNTLPKNKKTVKLFWKEVKDDPNILTKAGKKRTIWDELKPIDVDISNLEQLFESKAKDLAAKEKNQDNNKKNEIIVLDPKRSNAINIGLTKLPPPRTIKTAILKMDSTIMNREGIEKLLMTMIPTEEEKTKITEAQNANPDIPLGPAELLLDTLASIGDLEPRLKLWSFRLDYDSAEKEAGDPLMDLKQAVEEIESNETFRAILSTLRTIGNFLNGVEVKGFHIDYLAKVPEVKDTVHKHSLLHHLCNIIMEKFPNTTDLYSEMGAVTRSSKVDYDEVAKSLNKMESECKASWEYHKLIAKHDGSSYSKSKMAEFLNDCAERIVVLGIIHRRVINRFYKLLVFLGFSGHTIRETKVNQVCKVISEFALEYRTTRERLIQQIEKKANHRERNKTRGKMITEMEKFRPQEVKEVNKAEQKLRQILTNPSDTDTTDSKGGNSWGRSRPKFPLNKIKDDIMTDQDDEILDSLLKTATAQSLKGEQRIRKKARYGDRKSLRRTRPGLDGLLDDQ